MSNPNFFERGGLWVVGQGVLFWAVIVSDFRWHHQWTSTITDILAWLFLAVGTVCGIAGALTLGRNLTPFPRPAAETRLVKHGIYGFIRHPLYTAVMSGILAAALFRASWPALGVFLAVVVFLDAKSRREERWLRERFPDYANYQRRVSRFVPWLY